MNIEDRIQDIELRAKMRAVRTMMRFHGFIGTKRDTFIWAARMFNAVILVASAPLVRAARSFAALLEVVDDLEECEECSHTYAKHKWEEETPNMSCTVIGCDCQHYISPEDIL